MTICCAWMSCGWIKSQQSYMTPKLFIEQFAFSIFGSQSRMIEDYEKCLMNCDWPTLREIMLKFAYFQELRTHLNHEQQHSLITHLQSEIVTKREPLVLQTGFIYFFPEKGTIRKREINAKSSKSIRSTKNKLRTGNTKLLNRSHQSKDANIHEIDQFDTFEDVQPNRSKYDQNVYYSQNAKPTIVFFIEISQLQPSLADKIRLINHEKVKFIRDVRSSPQLNKSKVQESLHKFKFLRLHFGQTLYSKAERSQYIVFLKSGSVQVFAGGKKSSHYIIATPDILGFHKSEEERARCVSQKVQCYIIKKGDFEETFQKNKQIKLHEAQGHTEPAILTFPRVPFEARNNRTTTPFAADHFQRQQDEVSSNSLKLPLKKSGHKSVVGLEESEEKKQRRVFLKRHFCNYYNDIFGDFSQRKIKQMGLDLSNQQNLKLYDIKILHRKAPSMEQIKIKLNRVRIDKINAFKERFHRDNFEQGSERPQK